GGEDPAVELQSLVEVGKGAVVIGAQQVDRSASAECRGELRILGDRAVELEDRGRSVGGRIGPLETREVGCAAVIVGERVLGGLFGMAADYAVAGRDADIGPVAGAAVAPDRFPIRADVAGRS